MSHLAPAVVDTTGLSDRAVSYLRTIVPIWWGALVAWALGQWPAVGDVLSAIGLDPTSTVVVTLVTGLAVAAWYAAWRWLEPHIPAWLVRLALGSAATPTYGVTLAPTTADGAAVITSVPGVTQPYGTRSIDAPPTSGD